MDSSPQNNPMGIGLNGLSKSAQTFTVGLRKIRLSTHPIHIVVWGNFPFNYAIATNIRTFEANFFHATVQM